VAIAKDFDALREPQCFGFYKASDKNPNKAIKNSLCDTACVLRDKCQIITLSEGVRAIGAAIKHQLGSLPEGVYPDTNSVADLVRLLMDGPDALTPPGPQVLPTEGLDLGDF
jgi:hypothetical protein